MLQVSTIQSKFGWKYLYLHKHKQSITNLAIHQSRKNTKYNVTKLDKGLIKLLTHRTLTTKARVQE